MSQDLASSSVELRAVPNAAIGQASCGLRYGVGAGKAHGATAIGASGFGWDGGYFRLGGFVGLAEECQSHGAWFLAMYLDVFIVAGVFDLAGDGDRCW